MWFHDECMGIDGSSKTGFWPCPSCRQMPSYVHELRNDVKALIASINELTKQNEELKKTLTEVHVPPAPNVNDEADNVVQPITEVRNLLEKHKSFIDDFKVSQPINDGLLREIHRDMTQVKNSIVEDDSEDSDNEDEEPEGTLLVTDSLGRDIVSTDKDLSIYSESGANFSSLCKYLRKNKHKYRHMYIVCGTNNCSSKKPLTKTAEECKKLLEEAKKHAENVYMSSVPPRKDTSLSEDEKNALQLKIDNFNQIMITMTEENNVKFINNDTNFKFRNDTSDDTLLGADGVHLSAAGVKRLISNLSLKEKAKCKFGNSPTSRWSQQTKSPTKQLSAKKPSSSNNTNEMSSQANSSGKDTVYFRGHKNPLSNFFPCELHVYGENSSSSEHAYQLRKAISMKDTGAAQKIRSAPTAKHAKDIGDTITTDQAWQDKKRSVMTHILREKLHQCPRYQQALTQSKGKKLVEDTSHNFWARGHNDDGQNVLGLIHDELRAEMIDLHVHENTMYSTQRKQHYNIQRKQDYNIQRKQDYPMSSHGTSNCWNCGEKNHTRRNCRFTHPIKCYSCQYVGHKSKSCPYQEY